MRNEPQISAFGVPLRTESKLAVSTFSMDRRRVSALALLAKGYSYKAVQAELGITRSTLYLWRKSPAFILALHHATEGALHATAEHTTGLVIEALDLLASMVRDPNTPAALRALAANAILEHHRKPTEPPRGRGHVARSSVASFCALVTGLVKAVKR
jgi:transposase-like protein